MIQQIYVPDEIAKQYLAPQPDLVYGTPCYYSDAKFTSVVRQRNAARRSAAQLRDALDDLVDAIEAADIWDSEPSGTDLSKAVENARSVLDAL